MPDKIISLYRQGLAKEKGAVKKDWGGKISVALAYPNSYRTGMSNLGFQVVYQLLNERKDIVAERIFLPEGEEMSLYLETGKPLLSMESQAPLHKFDLVAFSLSFENDYPNILRILHLGKVPQLSEERDNPHPFVIAGGITTFLNPEPLSHFFDFFLLGEAEGILNEFIDLFKDIRQTSSKRQDVLKTLARDLKFVYVPSLYHIEYRKDGTIQSMVPEQKSIPEKIETGRQPPVDAPISLSKILTPETHFSNKILVELGRGCGRSCRFCAAGYVYRPPRFHDQNKLVDCVEKALEDGQEIGLLSTAVSDTPGIERITRMIVEKGGTFSVSSLRADTLTESLLENLKNAGQRTLAIAPEAGSDRLRQVINKHLSEDQIIEAVQRIARTGHFDLRLYFMIGLPTETKDDVEGIVDLVKVIKHHIVKESRTRGRIGHIKLSVNCFIPKPFTPFQWFPMEQVKSLKAKQKWLKKALGREGGIKVSFDLPKWAYVQTLLSMGDRRVGAILSSVHQRDENWTKAFRHSELNPDFFVYRPRDSEETLPWDFIDNGIRKEHLLKEYKLALKGRESDVCRVGDCDRCGVC